MSQIKANNVEYKLEQGYGNPEPGSNKATAAPEPEHGLIPKEYRPLAWMMMIGFLVCFLGNFAAYAAYATYEMYVRGSWSAPSCWDFKLLFYCNMTMGLVYGFVSLLLLIPGCDEMFYSLYWDPDTFPTYKSNTGAIIRQMAFVLLAINVSQCVYPSNTGVGLVALCVSVMVAWNFVLLSCFDFYSGVRYFLPMEGVSIRLADFYFVASIVFTALFSVGLGRTNVFYMDWKNDDQNQQTWLFYLNCVCGISYMIVGILNFLPVYNRWFMSFYFVDPPKARTPHDFFHRNGACFTMGIAAACLIAPQNPGVGVVGFAVHLVLILWFLMALCGFAGEIKNKGLWVGWLINALLFTALYGYALNRLDECDATDSTCGMFKDWTEQPWDTYKGLGENSTWTVYNTLGCTEN